MISTNSNRNKSKSLIIPLLIIFSICAIIKLTGIMLLPFIIAALISEIIFPISQRIAAKTKIPKKAVSIILLTVTLFAIVTIISLFVSRSAKELSELLYNLKNGDTGYFFDRLSEIIKAFTEKPQNTFNIFPADTIDIQTLIKEAITSAVSSAVNYLSSALISIVTKIPTIMLFIISTVVSSYYFCADRETIYSYFTHLFSPYTLTRIRHFKSRILYNLSKYLKACFILSAITFIQTFIGLSSMRIKYAFLISLAAAISDLLPIIGAGTVLIPTAIYAFITLGNKNGIMILILYGFLTVTRQIAEPKIMGASLGLHPLAALASICAGIGFFGTVGIFIGPIIAIVIKEILKVQTSEPNNITPQITNGAI